MAAPPLCGNGSQLTSGLALVREELPTGGTGNGTHVWFKADCGMLMLAYKKF